MNNLLYFTVAVGIIFLILLIVKSVRSYTKSKEEDYTFISSAIRASPFTYDPYDYYGPYGEIPDRIRLN